MVVAVAKQNKLTVRKYNEKGSVEEGTKDSAVSFVGRFGLVG